jgi:hypothetical protein
MQAPENRRSLDTYLRSAKDLTRLAAHADRLLALQQTYAQIAPHYLAEASQVANYKSGKVVIHAASGAVAAKINQLGPSLRDEFCKRGCEVTEIAARVQVRTLSGSALPAPPARAISAAAAIGLAKLGGKLPPGSPLATALKRLLDHARRER